MWYVDDVIFLKYTSDVLLINSYKHTIQNVIHPEEEKEISSDRKKKQQIKNLSSYIFELCHCANILL